jgi:flagellar hook-length control protein FliK
MDIQHTPKPLAKAASATPVDKHEADASAAVKAPAFAQLLQGLQGDAVALQTSATTLAAAAEHALADVSAVPLHSLVGQTLHLDSANADAALQDGSFLLAQQEVGLANGWQAAPIAGAQPHTAVGQSVATVAAGVAQTMNAQPMVTMAANTTAVALAQVADWSEGQASALADSVATDTPMEGRVALLGNWQLEDPQAPVDPALQRLMGQVEQWAMASAGAQPKPSERSESGKTVAGVAESLAAGQGSGTRLTEQAVKETQQSATAQFEAPSEAPVQDMRFWLQGRQQRAQLVMEKDGQPVRVQVSLRGNAAQVTFSTDQLLTRELLDGGLAQLREMLAQQGVELTAVQVQAGGSDGTQGDAEGASPSNPWERAPTLHGQVVVPVDAQAPVRSARSGLDLYA